MQPHSSNFREICMGTIAPKVLYRSEHPVCNIGQVNDIIIAANTARIKTIINLSDTVASLKEKLVFSPWYKKRFDAHDVITLGISMKFEIMEDDFTEKVKLGIEFMTAHEPPYLIHCEAGVDRAGSVAILLESFMGTSFDDMVKDYMLSFVDSDSFSENDYNNGSRYLFNIFSKIKGGEASLNDNFQALSEQYLKEYVCLSPDTLTLLSSRLG